MQDKWFALIELLLVFVVVFGWGLRELRQLKRYREKPRSSGSEQDS